MNSFLNSSYNKESKLLPPLSMIANKGDKCFTELLAVSQLRKTFRAILRFGKDWAVQRRHNTNREYLILLSPVRQFILCWVFR